MNFEKKIVKETLKTCLASWKMMEEAGVPVPAHLVWATVLRYKYYKIVCSSVLGDEHKTTLYRREVINATAKKGAKKMYKLEHLSKGGIGGEPIVVVGSENGVTRFCPMGVEPTFYQIKLEITPVHFKFVGIGNTLEECFAISDTITPSAVGIIPSVKSAMHYQRKMD